MDPLQEYYNEFVRMPDYDLTNQFNEALFFNEGGFTRFIPKFPTGGYAGYYNVTGQQLPGVALPQIQQPQYDDVQHLNAMTSAVGTLAQTRQGQQRLIMAREEMAQNKELNALNLEARRQELDFRKTQFEHQKMTDNFTMMNTLKDDLLSVDILAKNSDAYALKLKSKNIPELAQLAMSGENPDAMSQFGKAIYELKLDPEIIGWQVEKKKFDSDQEAIKGLDPILVNSFSNNTERVTAGLNGKSTIPDFYVSPENQKAYDQYKTQQRETGLAQSAANVDKAKADAYESQAKGYKAKVDADINKIGFDQYQQELSAIEAGGGTAEEKAKLKEAAGRRYQGKYGSSSTSARQFSDPFHQAMEYYMSPEGGGNSQDVARQMAGEDEKAKNSNYMNYAGGGVDKNGNPTGMGLDPFSKAIQKMVGSTYSTYANIPPTERGTLSGVINTSKTMLSFHGTKADGKVLVPLDKTPAILGPGDDYNPTFLKLNPDGTTTILGNVVTTDYKLAKQLNPTLEEKEEGDKYVIDGVMVSGANTDFNINLPGFQEPVAPAATTPPAITTPPNITVSDNVGFKGDAKPSQFNQTVFDSISQLPVPVILSEGSHHKNKDNFDIGLGGESDANARAYDFITDEERGLPWAILNGYEVQLEDKPYTKSGVNSKGETATFEPGSYFHAAMFTTVNDKATAKHMHVQRYQDRPINIIDSDTGTSIPARADFNKNLRQYTISYMKNKGDKEPTVFSSSPEEYLFLIQEGMFQPR